MRSAMIAQYKNCGPVSLGTFSVLMLEMKEIQLFRFLVIRFVVESSLITKELKTLSILLAYT